MTILNKKSWIGFVIILNALFISGCGTSPEEQAATAAALTAAAATSTFTVTPTSTTIPSSTPTPTITLTSTPTETPTITPTFSPETLNLPAGAPLNIGYLLWETNPFGIDSIRGIEIAISDFGGELFGHPVELTGLDSECNEFAGLQGSRILMQDKSIIGVIGTTCSLGGIKAAPIVSDNNRVIISPSNSSPDLTAPDTHAAGYFRTGPNDLVQIKAAALYAYDELGARRMATIRGATGTFQRLYVITLCEFFEELGGECVLDKAKDVGSTYVTPIINSLVEAAPDAIYFMGWDYQEGAAFISEAKKSPDLADTAIFLWETYNNPGFLEQAGEDAIGVYITATSYEFDWENNLYQTFLDTYRNKYNEEPISNYHPYSYDAATLLLKAIAQVAVQGDDGSMIVDPLAVRDALYNKVEFQGLGSFVSCSEFGDCASTANGKVYQFISGDPDTFNPGPADSLSSNPAQVWP